MHRPGCLPNFQGSAGVVVAVAREEDRDDAGDGDCEEDGHDDGYDCDFAVVVALRLLLFKSLLFWSYYFPLLVLLLLAPPHSSCPLQSIGAKVHRISILQQKRQLVCTLAIRTASCVIYQAHDLLKTMILEPLYPCQFSRFSPACQCPRPQDQVAHS